MVPTEFEGDLMAHGYTADPKPVRQVVRPDPKLIEILSNQIAFSMAIPAGMFVLFAGLLLIFAIN